jgi:hypothetical protein
MREPNFEKEQKQQLANLSGWAMQSQTRVGVGDFAIVTARLNRLQKEIFRAEVSPPAAKADSENEAVIAVVNRSTPARQKRACWGSRRCATTKSSAKSEGTPRF